MDKGLVSRNVKSLVDGGLVASCTHEVGSLIHLLNLTVAGKQVFDTALPRMRRRQQMLQDTLGQDDVDALRRMLATLERAAEEPET